MIPLLATALGAVIALASTLLVEIVRSRRAHAAALDQVRYEAYLGFVLAIQRAQDLLSTVPADSRDPAAEVVDAMRTSGLYEARERLLVTGSADVVLAGEAAFRSLLQLRDAVAQGIRPFWPNYRPATDTLAEIVWTMRQAARREFQSARLDLDQLASVPVADVTERLPMSTVNADDSDGPALPVR